MENCILDFNLKNSLKTILAYVLDSVGWSLEDFKCESSEFYSNVTTAKLKANVFWFFFFPETTWEWKSGLSAAAKRSIQPYNARLFYSSLKGYCGTERRQVICYGLWKDIPCYDLAKHLFILCRQTHTNTFPLFPPSAVKSYNKKKKKNYLPEWWHIPIQPTSSPT